MDCLAVWGVVISHAVSVAVEQCFIFLTEGKKARRSLDRGIVHYGNPLLLAFYWLDCCVIAVQVIKFKLIIQFVAVFLVWQTSLYSFSIGLN